jgi:hypothetical protein
MPGDDCAKAAFADKRQRYRADDAMIPRRQAAQAAFAPL